MKTIFTRNFCPLRWAVLSLACLPVLGVRAGTTNVIGSTTLSYNVPITITAGNVTQSTGTLSLNADSSPQFNAVTGAGMLQLVSTTDNATTSPDIYFNANDAVQANSTANDGTEISASVNLGSAQRYVFGLTDHNGVGKYGASSGADCTFAGAITGTGGITFVAQDNYTGSNPMECPFYLTAVNTFTGPVEIQRGAVYLGNAGALTTGNVLRFNAATGNNAKFFLYGNSASIADLQSPGSGTALIADGNLKPGNVGPATLTITQNNPYTYSGTITDTNSEYNATSGLTQTPTLSLVKNGAAALTLTGPLLFSGSVTVNAGKLYVNTTSPGGGLVTVANGAILGGSGTISSLVIVSNGAALEAGDGTGNGTLKLKAADLGIGSSDAITINCGASPGAGIAGYLSVTNVNGLTNNGVVTINVNGTLPSTVPATYTLIAYSGVIKGGGSFALGSVPDSAVGYITNNTAASAIQLVLSSVTVPSITWVGAPLNNWDLLGSNVWRQTGTTTPANYTNGSVTVFDDTASNFAVNVATAVAPASWLVTNSANNYVFSGGGGVTGGGLTKTGSGTLTLDANDSYSGNTTIAAGTVVLGSATAIPSGPGGVIVNGTLDVNGFSPTYNNLSGTGVVDNVTAGGSPVLTVPSTASPVFGGTIQNSSGSLALNVTGTGTFTLNKTNNYSGGTVIGSLSAGGGTLALGTNNALPAGGALSIDNRGGTSVLSLGAFNQNIGAITLQAGSAIRTIITGSGTLTLSSNLTLADPHIVGGGQDYALAFSPTIDLNGATRTFIVGYGNNAESTDLGDLHLNGSITNSTGIAGLTLTPWTYGGTTYYGSVTFGAANTYNGPTTLTGGTGTQGTSTLALNANYSIPNNSAFIQSANTILDLTAWGKTTGITTGMGSLTGAGTITLGAAGVLTIGYDNTSPAAYAGSIGGAGGSIIKTGTGTLTLSGVNTYTGKTMVLNGTLLINGSNTGGGAVTVSNAATLGGNGSIVSLVTVSNGAAVQAGDLTGAGTLTLKNLNLGTAPSDAITLNYMATPAGIADLLNVTNANGLTNNGTVTINVGGHLPATAPVTYTLVTYAGAIQGAGTFALVALPNQAVGYLTNNTAASALQLVIVSVIVPSVTWVGTPTNDWDLLGGDVWTQTGLNVPAAYADYDAVVLDDTASNFVVNLAATVTPDGVLITNNVNNYSIIGNGGISGYTGLVKTGAGELTLATANSYSGPTAISGGTLALGAAGAIPGGAGAGTVTINGTLDLGGFSPTLNNLSGGGVVDNISAGGSPVLSLAGTTNSTFAGVIQNTSGTLELNYNGTGSLSLAGSNTYSGVTVINSGTLQVGTGGVSGTLGSGQVLDDGKLAFNRADTNAVPNDVLGTGALVMNGTGMTTLNGNLTYAGPTIVNAGTLVFPHDVTYDAGAGTTLTVASNAIAETGFEIFLNSNPNSVAVDISGAGTTRLISTLNRIESYADVVIGNNNNGVSTANFGIRIASGLDLGSTERLFWAYSSRDDVTTYGLTGCDCQFAGPVSGTAQLQLLGHNSWPGVNTMEEQFAFNAVNTWTGPLEVLRGSVYLGNAGAFTNGNVLILDPAASVNSRFFLYGFNASVSDLQSGGYGTMLIANGNNLSSTNVGPATLTVTENNATTFAGGIMDWYTEYTAPVTGPLTPTLSLVKNGPGALTLTGANTYSGTTVINGGKLYLNNSSTGGGAVTVNTNATLGGSGLINSAVTVKNGGSIESGDGTRNGTMQLKSLALGSTSGDLAALNLSAAAILNVTNNNGLVLNGGTGSVTVNVGGIISSLGAVPLITYKGALGGTGYGAFVLGSTPPGISGYLSNDTVNASVDFVATLVTIPRWTGGLSSEWSTNTLAAPKNWVLDSDGVTAIDYFDGENVKFDDTAANPTVNLPAANVSPAAILFSNSVQNYVVSGVYGITGAATLTKQGSGSVTLATTNAYTGGTTITTGTLVLGAAGALPSGAGAGNVTVNGTLDLGGFSAAVNNLSGSGTVDNVTAGGSPVLKIDDTTSPTFAGVIKNTTGTVGLNLAGGGTLTLTGSNTYTGPTVVGSGALNIDGALGAGGVTVQNGAALGGTGTIGGPIAMVSGSALELTANSPLTVGAVALNGSVSVYVSGNVSVTNTATYVLLKHAAKSGAGAYLLAPVAGIAGTGFTATLNDTNNQLLLVIAPTASTGTIADVKHVVIFMQENRSFDHYFGSLHGVHGYSDHVTLTFTNGNSDLYQPSGSSYELPFHTTVPCLSDLDHSWSATHQAVDSGKDDAWIAAKGKETMAFYNRSDISYYYSLADNFTICDEYHCSILSSTDPNRVFFMTGFNDPNDLGGGPLIDNTEPANGWGTNWVTYPELLQKAGVTWKIFQASDNYDDNALNWFAAYKDAASGTPLYNNGEVFAPSVDSGTGFPADYTNLITEFQTAVSNNTLPAVSWIIGPDVGSEHPSWSPADGEILTKGLLDALASNPKVYNSTVFILNYDENDGFYDHAVPINPPAGTANEFDSGLPYGLGMRVPCIIISPWSTGGYVCSQVFDHTSIIRFLETWTGVQEPNISAWRRQVCGDLTSAFDFTHLNTNYPSLLLSTENDCPSGSTASPPGTQTVPVQEAGTLLQRPLPYQPNATPVLNVAAGNFYINMTNSGAAAVHFSLYPNAYRNDGAWPYDVASSNATTSIAFNTTPYGGNYDFSCYGPNGFLRRFGGNLTADSGNIESIAYLNPSTGGVEITLANGSSSAVTFSVTNGYFANSLATYTVPANRTNVVAFNAATNIVGTLTNAFGTFANTGWYDLAVTASSDSLFVRRFAGHVETANAIQGGLVSSENASSFGDNVAFTETIAGYGTPTGSVQFLTNGVTAGAPVPLVSGVATFSTAGLGGGTNVIAAAYSGDLLNQPVTNGLSQVVIGQPPVITLNGAAMITNECGASFSDPGVVVTDAASQIVSLTTNYTVNISIPGSYLITYVAVDALSNAATNTRTVVVQDTTAPVVTLNGPNPMTNWLGTVFVDPGATAYDLCAGVLSVTTNGVVNSTVAGTYTLQYIAIDPAFNSATNTRTVLVVAEASPVLSSGTMLGDGNFQLTFSGPVGQPYKVMTGTDLTQMSTWTNYATGVFGSAPVTFEDTNAPGLPTRFYRVVSP